jgi:F1F0 ATPase subunit 2
MTEFWSLAPTLPAGLLLGAFFFGGLWWTVARGMASAWPALWFAGSLLVRMSLTMAGFFVVGREDWRRWLLCLAGFAIARLVVKPAPRPTGRPGKPRSEETGYAP